MVSSNSAAVSLSNSFNQTILRDVKLLLHKIFYRKHIINDQRDHISQLDPPQQSPGRCLAMKQRHKEIQLTPGALSN